MRNHRARGFELQIKGQISTIYPKPIISESGTF